MIDGQQTYFDDTRYCVMYLPLKGGWFAVDLDDEEEDVGPYDTSDAAMEALEYEFPCDEDDDDLLVVVERPSS